MKKSLLMILCLIANSVFFANNIFADESKLAIINQWLGYVDNDKFSQSWEESAQLFKAQVTEAQWEAAVNSARAPYGKLKNRKVVYQQAHDSLPNVPKGEYFVVQFSAEYQNKDSAIETVTLVKDNDSWRVVGYFID